MPKQRLSTHEILSNAHETLKTAEYGLRDLSEGPPERKLSGLRNLVVFGRAVTNVLQLLKSKPGFNEWYQNYVREMESDPLMKYFYNLRSTILKEGVLRTSAHANIKKLEFPQDMSSFGPPPPFAKGFFIGDQSGGSGWEVELPDGSKVKYYVELPSDIGSVSLHFPNPPDCHLGVNIDGYPIERLSLLYLGYLQKMVQDAKVKFEKTEL